MDNKFDENQYKNLDEWYKAMNEMYEEDAKTNDYSTPELDKWFYGMLENERKKAKRRRIAGMAAGIALVLGIGTNVFTEVAYGESLFTIIRNSIEAGQFTISSIGNTDDNNQEFEDYEDATICYEADSIEKLFEQIIDDKQITINEFFYMKNLPNEYTLWTAKYNAKFQTLTIYSKKGDNYFHIYEELNYQNIVSGTILESEIVATIFNENLQMEINIVRQMENIRVDGFFIEVFYNNKRLKIEGNATLKEFESIAKNICL